MFHGQTTVHVNTVLLRSSSTPNDQQCQQSSGLIQGTGKCVHVTKKRITCGGQCGEWIYSVQSRDIRERHGAFSDFSIVTYGSLAIMTVVGSFFLNYIGEKSNY